MSFDPDAYLADSTNFDPDKYLSEKPTDIKSAGDFYKRSPNWFKNTVGVGAALADMVGSIPGAIAGTGTGVYAALANKDPSGGLQLAKDIMQQSTPTHAMGVDMSDNPGYNYAMKPMEWLSKGIEMSGQGYEEIAKLLGARESTGKNIASSVELGLMTGMLKPGKSATGKIPPNVSDVLKSKEQKPIALPKPEATLWEDAPTAKQEVLPQPIPDQAGYNAFDKILESQISGEQSPMRQYADPMEQMKQQLALQKQAQIQSVLDQRQKQMEMDVARQQSLDFNAAERARQQAAPVTSPQMMRNLEAQRAAEIQGSIDKTQELNTRGQQMGIVEDFGNNDPMSRMPNMRVDENGIPIRADLSMEAQNLQNPLQRNLWGDELGPALEQGRSLTDAIDAMPPSHARDMALSQLTGQPPARSTLMNKDFWSNKQRGAINPQLLKWADEKFERALDGLGEVFKGMTLQMQTSPYGPELTVVKDGKEIASMYTKVNGDNLEVGRVHVNDQYRSQGLAKVMYNSLSYMGNDIVRSTNQLPEGKAMWDHWEQTGFAKNGMINKQSGKIDVDAIANSLRSGYSRFEKAVNDFGKVNLPKTITADERAKLVPGMGNAVDGLFVKPKDAADILPSILAEKDGPSLFKSIQQGLSATSEKVGSSLMRYTSDWLNYVDKKTEFDYKKMVKPTQQALVDLGKEKVKLSQVLLNEMFNKKRYSPEELSQLGLSTKAQKAYQALRDNLDMVADRYDAGRAKLGLEPIDRGEAYVAALRNGSYHIVVNAKDSAGNLRPVWHVAEHSIRDAYKAVNWFKENLKDVPNIDMSSIDRYLDGSWVDRTVDRGGMYRKSNKFYNVPKDVLGAHMELAKLIDNSDTTTTAIREAIKAAAEKAGYDVGNTKQRFMEKANIRGFEGDKPWLTPEQNANSLLNSQLQTIKEGINWTYHQDMVAQLKDLLSNEELQKSQPNNVAMVNSVLQSQMGLSKSIMKDVEDFASRAFGADRAGLKNLVQDMKVFTYLQQLGMSVGYMMATPLQALNSVGAAIRERGIGALSPTTAAKAFMDGSTALMNDLGMEIGNRSVAPMTEIGGLALKYAEDNGIINKLVFNAGHEVPRVDSTPSRAMQIYQGTMSVPEKMSRLYPYMAFVHHLNDMGIYKDPVELFKRAEELTEFTQINFRSSEKPTFVKTLGALGDLAYVYKAPIFNYFNQISTYTRDIVNGKNRVRNVAALGALLGVTGYLGGTLALPLVNEIDGGYNVYKDIMAKWFPQNYNLDLGIKGAIITKLPKAVVYGAVSDVTGAQMSSRFAPNAVDVEKPLSGIAPVGAEIGEQAAVAKFLADPNYKNFVQGAYANSPPMVRGLMETNMDIFKGAKRPDGKQVYVNPNDITAQKAMVARTPEQEAYRKLGLRELNEARKVDINKINNAEQSRIQTAVEGLIDRGYFNAIKGGKPQEARQAFNKILELNPDDGMLQAAIAKKINENATTPEEREYMRADIIQNLMKIKRLRDAGSK